MCMPSEMPPGMPSPPMPLPLPCTTAESRDTSAAGVGRRRSGVRWPGPGSRSPSRRCRTRRGRSRPVDRRPRGRGWGCSPPPRPCARPAGRQDLHHVGAQVGGDIGDVGESGVARVLDPGTARIHRRDQRHAPRVAGSSPAPRSASCWDSVSEPMFT